MNMSFESLENRTMMSTVPYPSTAIGSQRAVWSVDTDGGTLTKVMDVGTTGQVVAYQNSLYIHSGDALYQTSSLSNTPPTLVAGNAELGVSGRVTWAGTAGGNLYYVARYDPSDENFDTLYIRTDTGAWSTVVTGGNMSINNDGNVLGVKRTIYNHPTLYYSGIVSGSTYTESTGSISGTAPIDATSVTVGNNTFYASDDGVHGSEIWEDNGTTTHLVKDIFPGANSSSPDNFNYVSGRVCFVASDPTVGETAVISGGTLFVGGSSIADNIVISSHDGMTTVTNTRGFTESATFSDADFSQILVRGGAGNDRIDLSGTYKPATIVGEAGNDTLIGGSGSDSVEGGAGDDLLLGSAGYDTLTGGAGTNTLDFASFATNINLYKLTLTVDGFTDQLSDDFQIFKSGSGDDSLYFQNGNVNYIDAGAGNDQITSIVSKSMFVTVHGGDGNDRIYISRSGGNATYFGDAGDDQFDVQRSTFTTRDFFGGAGNDTVDYTGFMEAYYTYSVSFNNLPDDGVGSETHGDNIHSDVETVLEPGDRTITNTPSVVEPVQEPGESTVTNTPKVPKPVVKQSPWYAFSAGVLTITGTGAADALSFKTTGSTFTAIFNGHSQTFNTKSVKKLIVNSGAGNDQLSLKGIAISANVHAGSGNDKVYGTSMADAIFGGAGNDWIDAGAGNDFIYGEAGNDHLLGNDGRDHMSGGLGADFIHSGGGKDILYSDTSDTLDGTHGDRLLDD